MRDNGRVTLPIVIVWIVTFMVFSMIVFVNLFIFRNDENRETMQRTRKNAWKTEDRAALLARMIARESVKSR
jgi:hypothetical protein